jgi:putative flippase GtrA
MSYATSLTCGNPAMGQLSGWFRKLAPCVLCRRDDPPPSAADPSLCRTAPRAHQVCHRRCHDIRPKPVTAKIIAGIVAVIASYILNREWSFRDRGGRERHHEALLFFGVSGVGVLLSMAPLWVSSYVLMLRVPMVTLMTENIADFISAYIIGNLLQMAFRFWAFRRFVFPDEFARNPEKALESTLTGGGIAEALEDEYELRHPHGPVDGTKQDDNVTPMRLSSRRRRAQRRLDDTIQPRVSKSS